MLTFYLCMDTKGTKSYDCWISFPLNKEWNFDQTLPSSQSSRYLFINDKHKRIHVFAFLHSSPSFHRYYRDRIERYTGPDPIGPRYDFITWLETHYPAKEKNKGPLFDEVVAFCKLVDAEPFNSSESRSDPRTIQIWLLYVSQAFKEILQGLLIAY